MSAELNFLHDQVLESLVRVRQFTTWSPPSLDTEAEEDLDHVAHLMVRRDALVLSASIRNFAESTKTTDILRGISIKLQAPVDPIRHPYFIDTTGNPSSVNLYKAYSRIIHATEMTVFRDLRFVPSLMGTTDVYKTYLMMTDNSHFQYTFGTIISVKSEHDGSSLLRLDTLLDLTVAYMNKTHQRLAGTHSLFPKAIRDS